MAKAAKKTVADVKKKKPGTALAAPAVGRAVAPAHLAKQKMTGAGTSQSANDLLVPMARVLQRQSDEAEKNSNIYVPGAEPGDILIKNRVPPIIKGDAGFLFQPCFNQHGYVEWLPRNKGGGKGQGFVKMHSEEPADTIDGQNPDNPEQKIRVRKGSGNWIVETRYHGGHMKADADAKPEPLMIPFAGSGHSVVKAWNALMNSKDSGQGGIADSFACWYHFVSRFKEKGANSWYLFEITDGGEPDKENFRDTVWSTLEEYEAGKRLYQDMTKGTRTFNAGDAAPEQQSGDGGKM